VLETQLIRQVRLALATAAWQGLRGYLETSRRKSALRGFMHKTG